MTKTKYLVAVLSFASVTAAWSFPTTARLTQAPQFRNEGQEVLIRTDKGTITASTRPDGVGIYQPFVEKAGVRGACYAFETESETDVLFNAKLDQSGARSVRPVPCAAAKR